LDTSESRAPVSMKNRQDREVSASLKVATLAMP